MRVLLTIDGRHVASLLEKDAKYDLGRMDKYRGDPGCEAEAAYVENGCLNCKITKKTAKRLIKELQWLLELPKEMD